MMPEGVRYTESHEWACREQDTSIVTIGLSHYAVEQLGDIVFLELPVIGTKVKKGDIFSTVESVKAASDLYSPVGGEIVQVNQELPEKLDLFKSDPYGSSWIIKVKPAQEQEFETLMDVKQYEQYLKGL